MLLYFSSFSLTSLFKDVIRNSGHIVARIQIIQYGRTFGLHRTCGPYATVSENVTVNNLNGATLLHLSEENLKKLLPKNIGERVVLRSLIDYFKRMATSRIKSSSTEAVLSLRGNVSYNESNTACTDPIASNNAGYTEMTNRTKSSTSMARSCSKTCGELTKKITIPDGFSPKIMAFLTGHDPILSHGMRIEIFSALFHKSVKFLHVFGIIAEYITFMHAFLVL